MRTTLYKKSGQGLVEYVLLVGLLSLVTIAALTAMGGSVSTGLLGNIADSLNTANSSITGS